MSLALVIFAPGSILAQPPGYSGRDLASDRDRGIDLLKRLKPIIKGNYYDATFGGFDLDAKFKEAEQRVKRSNHISGIYAVVADLLLDLGDSHTYFVPPERTHRVEYGFSTMMVGPRCFVTHVKQGSDAETKGISPGDEILSLNDYRPTRDTLSRMLYLLYVISPQTSVTLETKDPNGNVRQLVVKSRGVGEIERKRERKRLNEEGHNQPYTCKLLDSEIAACKLRTFITSKGNLDKLWSEVGNRKLILDLRGNHGGYSETAKDFIARFFEQDVVLGSELRRGKSKKEIIEGSKKKAFAGEVVVLVDSETASAAEVVARVIQLEKRGVVVGDVTSGRVLTSVRFAIAVPLYNSSIRDQPYNVAGVSLAVSDLLMSDGGRLEGKGVIPERLIGPGPTAFKNKTDPVLALAANYFGSKLNAEEAGKLGFLVARTEDSLAFEGSIDDK